MMIHYNQPKHKTVLENTEKHEEGGIIMDEKTISAKELRKVLRLGRSKTYELIYSEGFYPAFKIGRKILINVDKLNQWIEEQKMEHEA